MKKSYLIYGIIGFVVVLFILLYNGLVSKSVAVDSAWAQVQTQYQRRVDLIPNLVSTIKAEANFEKSTLTEVINARASVSKINVDPNIVNDTNKFAQFQQAQGQLSQALGKLIMVSERYPELKTNQQFAQLMDSLEGTENRIAYSRDNYNQSVRSYNSSIISFPTVLIAKFFGYNKKEYFQSDIGANKVPEVKF